MGRIQIEHGQISKNITNTVNITDILKYFQDPMLIKPRYNMFW